MKSIIWLHNVYSHGLEYEAILSSFQQEEIHHIHFQLPSKISSFESLFTDLNHTILSTQQDKVYLVAYSWAAYEALTYLILNPDHVERVFLINPLIHEQFPFSKNWIRGAHVPWIDKLYAIGDSLFNTQRYLKTLFAPQVVPLEIEKTLRPLLQTSSTWQAANVYKHLIVDFPLSEELKSYPIPIRALFGEQDSMAPFASQISSFQALINFSYSIIPAAGHALPWTHTNLIINEIKSFVK